MNGEAIFSRVCSLSLERDMSSTLAAVTGNGRHDSRFLAEVNRNDIGASNSSGLGLDWYGPTSRSAEPRGLNLRCVVIAVSDAEEA